MKQHILVFVLPGGQEFRSLVPLEFAPSPGDVIDAPIETDLSNRVQLLILNKPAVHQLHPMDGRLLRGSYVWLTIMHAVPWTGDENQRTFERDPRLMTMRTISTQNEMILERLKELLDVFRQFRSSN